MSVSVCFSGIEKTRHSALACCVAYMFRYCGMIDLSCTDVRLVESCPTFLMRDTEAFWLELNKKVIYGRPM